MADNDLALPRGEYVGQELALYNGGLILPQKFGEIIEYAQMMAKGGLAVPKHLRGEPGICMAIIQRSLNWGMDPWAVATKTYSVNDQLAYEAQLVAAVVLAKAPIKEKVIKPFYSGDGGELQCSFLLHHRETGEEIPYESPKKKDIKPQNSPLWNSSPKQQIYYYSIREMARRHFPGLLLGVYDVEEAASMRDITPRGERPARNSLIDPPIEEIERANAEDVEEAPTAKTEFERASDAYDAETGEVEEESGLPSQGEMREAAGKGEPAQAAIDLTPDDKPEPVPVEVVFDRMKKNLKAFGTLDQVNEWVMANGDWAKKNLSPAQHKELQVLVKDRRWDLDPNSL